MIYLLLCILSSTTIVIVFKLLERFNVNTFAAIATNYIFAASLGFLLNNNTVSFKNVINSNWLGLAFVIGLLFILMFWLMGKTIKYAGVSVSTVAGRMSVILPITFSIIYDKEILQAAKLAGIILAVLAVVLTVYKKPDAKVNRNAIIFPIIIFFGLGAVDTFVKYAQSTYVSDNYASIFSGVLFTISCVSGLIIVMLSKKLRNEFFKLKTLLLGGLLGIANFGSIYFILLALNSGSLDGSVIFGVNNIGIVVLAVFSAYLFFNEKLSKINYFGIFLSVAAALLLMFESF